MVQLPKFWQVWVILSSQYWDDNLIEEGGVVPRPWSPATGECKRGQRSPAFGFHVRQLALQPKFLQLGLENRLRFREGRDQKLRLRSMNLH